jgi:hypothetical protein
MDSGVPQTLIITPLGLSPHPALNAQTKKNIRVRKKLLEK